MKKMILAAALVAQGTALAAADPAPAPAAAPAAEAPPPQLKINPDDLTDCAALAVTMAQISGDDERGKVMQLLGLNWQLVLNAAQGGTKQDLKVPFNAALARYKTQVTNGAQDETLSGVITDLLDRRFARCESVREVNQDFFAFELGQYVEQVKAQQAAAAAAPAPAPATPAPRQP